MVASEPGRPWSRRLDLTGPVNARRQGMYTTSSNGEHAGGRLARLGRAPMPGLDGTTGCVRQPSLVVLCRVDVTCVSSLLSCSWCVVWVGSRLVSSSRALTLRARFEVVCT